MRKLISANATSAPGTGENSWVWCDGSGQEPEKGGEVRSQVSASMATTEPTRTYLNAQWDVSGLGGRGGGGACLRGVAPAVLEPQGVVRQTQQRGTASVAEAERGAAVPRGP